MTLSRPALWAVAAALLTATDAAAQLKGISRLARDEPEIQLAAGGRAGACDVLMFTPDGAELIAAGEDKVVHGWAVGPAGLTPMPTLHWNTFRERRGSIYAAALHGDRIAVAGFGKFDPDIAVFDRGAGTIVAALSPTATNGYGTVGGTVWSLAFNRAGTELAAGDDFGNVWAWRLGGDGGVTKVAAGGDQLDYAARVVWVGYLADGRLAFARRDGQVRAVGAGGRTERLFSWAGGTPNAVGASRDGRWLAATPARETENGSAVEVRSLPDGAVSRIVRFERGQLPDRLALDDRGQRLAVAVSRFGAAGKPFVSPPGAVAVYDLTGATPKLVAERAGLETRPDRLAFAPGGNRLAAAGGSDHATWIWEIAGGKLSEVARDTGKALPLWGVRMTADGRYLGVQSGRAADPDHPNRRSAGEPWKTFDLVKGDWAAAPVGTFVPPADRLGGWGVHFSPRNELVWYAVAPDGARQKLPLNELQDDRPQCYTFLPGVKEGTVRLAVGHLWGITVFELAAGREPKLERKLTGHVGFVTSVAPALGGQALVSCGRDQVVAFWSLADFPSQATLGAKFAFTPKGATVTKVDAGSPAEEAGLVAGDAVTKLAFDGEWIAPAEWEKRLTNPVPMKELAFKLKTERVAGEPACKTSVLHRPVARFAPFTDDEWVLYTYRQCYFTSSVNGDQYVRWLVSKERADRAPEVFRVDQFPMLRRPEKVADVLGRLVREPCAPVLPDKFPPEVRLELAAAEVNAGDVDGTVTLTPRARQDGKANPIDFVEVWLNGHHRVKVEAMAGKAVQPGVPVALTFKIPADQLRSGDNSVQAIATAADAGYGESNAVKVRNLALRSNRRLYGLVAGINTYQAIDGADLRAPVSDARKIHSAWTGQRGRGAFERGLDSHLKFVAEHQVTKEAILAAIKDAREATPDDLFILFLAGHGVQSKGKSAEWYYVIPHMAAGVPVKGGDWRASSLQDEILVKALTDDLKCQPVVFLDCCHSGAAGRLLRDDPPPTAANQTRSIRTHGKGPVVISACSAEELAWEDPQRGGYFAGRIVRALGVEFAAADTNGDGRLTADELYGSVKAGVAEDVLGQTDEQERPIRQTPQIAPPADALRGLILATKPGK